MTVQKTVNLMAMRDPSQSPRGQEKAQVVVIKGSHHFFPTRLAPWPWPRGAPFVLQSSTMCIQTSTSLWQFKQRLLCRSGFHPMDTPYSEGEKDCAPVPIFPGSALLMNLPARIPLALPTHPNPFSLVCVRARVHTHTHTHTHTHNSLELSP